MKYKIVFCLLIVCTSRLFGQDMAFDRITIENGLVEGNVLDIKQDAFGYMWFSTQNGLVRYDGYKLKTYKPGIDIKGSFPDYTIVKVMEDDQKNLWALSSQLGLFKYNRETDHFVQIEKATDHSFHSRKDMVKDGDNDIWVLNSDIYYNPNARILEKIDLTTGKVTAYSNIAKGGHFIGSDVFFHIYNIQNQIWLTTRNGIFKYDTATGVFKKSLNGLPSDTTTTDNLIYCSPQQPGMFWVAQTNSSGKSNLYRYNFNKNTFEDLAAGSIDSAFSSRVSAFYEDKQNRLWISCAHGLILYNFNSGAFLKYPFPVVVGEHKPVIVKNIVETKEGTLWLATVGQGAINFNPVNGKFTIISRQGNNPHGLASNYLNSVLVDLNNILWVSPSFGGVGRQNLSLAAFREYFNHGSVNDYFPGGAIFDIAQDDKGLYWIGSEKGLYSYDLANGQLKQVDIMKGAQLPVNKLMITKDKQLYCVVSGPGAQSGLYIYDIAKQRVVKILKHLDNDLSSLPSNNISVMHQDRTGTVWLGTYDKGIISYNPATGKIKPYPFIINDEHVTPKNKLDDRFVHAIYEDCYGTIWVGTDAGGLNFYNRGKDIFTSVYDPYSAMYCVNSISGDNNGKLWIGTYESGVYVVDRYGKIIKRIGEKDGLVYEGAIGVSRDSAGDIWVQTARGLSEIGPIDYSIKNYKNDGRLPLTGASIGIPFFKNKAGEFVMIGDKGFVLLNPAKLPFNTYPPQVHIETIASQNPRGTKADTTLIQAFGHNNTALPWNQNQITFNYVAINFINPAQNKYAYRLDGYQQRWVQAAGNRSVTYSNLSPGTYVFHVIAANSSGVWNHEGDSITIIINSPWWLTWYAWLLYIVLFGWAVYAFIAYRSRKLRQDNKLLEHKVRVRTDEVLQQKEEIEAQRDNLEKAFTELKTTQSQLVQREKMASLGELTAGIAHEIQNPLNFVNNFSEVSIELLGELKQEAEAGNKDDVIALANDLTQNLEKINHHGKRADNIVKGMLEHSRAGTGEKQLTDLNVLADEFLKLSYQVLRAKDKDFNAELLTHFNEKLPKANVSQQDIGRVLLNLFNNAFYAVNQKLKTAGPDYKPTVEVSTSSAGVQFIISVKDNGSGIPSDIKDKIMQPFFTTKPTGEGTGLGLSLSYDIVVKGHGGSISVDTKEGEFTEFIVTLPIS